MVGAAVPVRSAAGDRDRFGPRGDLGGLACRRPGARPSACRRILLALPAVSALAFLVALVGRPRHRRHRDVPAAHRRRRRDPVRAPVRTAVPNAVAFTGSYLLGPGFAVGAQTLVSPAVVVLGPLPLFPLLAALPANAAPAAWTGLLLVLPARARRSRAPARSAARPRCAGTRARCAAAPAGSSPACCSGWSRRLRRCRRSGPDACRRAGRLRRAGARDHRVRDRWPGRRAGDDVVAAPRGTPYPRGRLTTARARSGPRAS